MSFWWKVLLFLKKYWVYVILFTGNVSSLSYNLYQSGKIDGLEKRLHVVSGDLEDSEDKLSEVHDKLEESQSDISDLKESVSDLRDDRTTENIDDAEDKANSVEQDINEAKQEVN